MFSKVSLVMDEEYLLSTVRYVELNPVKAGLCRYPADWKWSSALPHLSGKDDQLVRVGPCWTGFPIRLGIFPVRIGIKGS
ncbi:hypothetical protein SAMN03097708_03211 [Thiohalomonas denitrificans]|uniref:Transposase n=1 Tax=Thiohalomonas denitrificans TaxID=415747 RepID=A0A1G5R1B3_9GAMM|nr:hypothetical protein SAMN03097708_03211 [Thiohalomonas denitrificans]